MSEQAKAGKTDKQVRTELRLRTKYLRDLSTGVLEFLTMLDDHMKLDSSTPEARNIKGKRIAALCNSLELLNDQARHFGLGISLKTDAVLKNRKYGFTVSDVGHIKTRGTP